MKKNIKNKLLALLCSICMACFAFALYPILPTVSTTAQDATQTTESGAEDSTEEGNVSESIDSSKILLQERYMPLRRGKCGRKR